MTAFTFEGWVDEIREAGQYDQEFVVRDCKNVDDPSVNFPQNVLFRVGTKKSDLIAMFSTGEVAVDAKVSVEFYPWCNRGTSQRTGREYCIGTNNVSKIVVLEKAPEKKQDAAPDEEVQADDGCDALPF